MAFTPERSYNDVIALFENGGIESTNLGLVLFGSMDSGMDVKSENRINNRGTILANFDTSDTWTINVECGHGKNIGISAVKSGTTYSCTLDFTQNNEIYTYEGIPLNSTSAFFNLANLPSAQSLAWALSAGYSVSFVHDYNYAISMHTLEVDLIPNAYDENKIYPSNVPIEVIEEREISKISLPFIQSIELDENTTLATLLYHFLEDITISDVSYDNGDVTPEGGGGGSYESRNDAMEIPNLPSLSAMSSGFVSLYAPTPSQMLQISEWLWSDNFFDNIIKNLSSPFENIIGLYISPIVPPTSTTNFMIGNVNSQLEVNKVNNSYIQKYCGSVNVKKYYNSFADFDNYRSFKMFLPYYGIVDISTDDFIGGTIEVYYNIDLFSGAATIFILTNRNGIPHILHQYATNIFSPVPYSGVNMMSYFQQMTSSSANLISQGINGNIMGMTSGVMGLLNAHPSYGGSKGITNMSGLMGIQYPYLIECRSLRDMPEKYNKYDGIPLNKYKKISSLSGFTTFESIRINAEGATNDELNEIENTLKGGVIL